MVCSWGLHRYLLLLSLWQLAHRWSTKTELQTVAQMLVATVAVQYINAIIVYPASLKPIRPRAGLVQGVVVPHLTHPLIFEVKVEHALTINRSLSVLSILALRIYRSMNYVVQDD